MDRVLFKSNKIRNKFFKNVRDSYSFTKWKSLYEELNILRSVFEKYKCGKLSLPINLFNNLKNKVNDDSFFKQDLIFLKKNWGQIKGGKNAYIINKKVFEQGRKIGLKNFVRKNNFNLDINLTNELSYFIGLFIGDGFSNKYGFSYQIQFIGHKISEKDFYENFISNLVSRLFSLKSKIIFDKDSNSLRLNIYSKGLLELLNKRFEIPLGKKFDKVEIPKEILNSCPEITLSCLAGLFDAEGCVFMDKRDIYNEEYPRIAFHINNKKLTKQVFDILKNEGINISNSLNFQMLNIYGKKNILLFLNKVKLQNPKHIFKLRLAKLI